MKKQHKKIYKTRVVKAKASSKWDLANDVLYQLCKKYPYHEEDDVIIAKTLIIGRVYSVALERNKRGNDDKNNDFFYLNEVTGSFRKLLIDTWINELDYKLPGESNAIPVLKTHYKLQKKLLKLTEHNKRSFASKYLHFHKPNLFFLYDSRAAENISKYISLARKKSINIKKQKGIDEVYSKFYYRCMYLAWLIKEKTGIQLSPREIDNFLIR